MNGLNHMNETHNTSKSVSVGATTNTCYICLETISTLLDDPVKPFTCDHSVCKECSNSLFTTPATRKCGICRNTDIRGIDMIRRIAQTNHIANNNLEAALLNARMELEEMRHQYELLEERNRVARLRIRALENESREGLPQNLPPSQNTSLLFPPYPTLQDFWTTRVGLNPIILGYNGGSVIRGQVSITIKLGSHSSIRLYPMRADLMLSNENHLQSGIQFEAKRRQDQFIEVRCNRTIIIGRQYNNDAIGEIRGQNRKEIFKFNSTTGEGEWRRFRILRRNNGSEYIQLNNTWRWLEIDASHFRQYQTEQELIGE